MASSVQSPSMQLLKEANTRLCCWVFERRIASDDGHLQLFFRAWFSASKRRLGAGGYQQPGEGAGPAFVPSA